ncbi:MAG: hypothetical protein JKY62_16325 [Desulfocapsa sp.]|nr:hypothetical protein [Desulfocapsa sp.]
MKLIIFLITSWIVFSLSGTTFAVEVAPRISDREIVEKLVILEVGQHALRSEMKTGQDALGKRIDDINQRFDDINQRFDDMNQRISNQQMTTLALFSAMIALILTLFAYIAWDRRTMIKPVVERLEHLENKLFRELEMNHDKGSTINRLINALRELAKQDEKVATVLRNFSLL